MTDEKLYRRYLDGDDEGLSELMKKYGDTLTLYIDGYLGDIHDAEDLMIEVFSYLLTKRPHIREGGAESLSLQSRPSHGAAVQKQTAHRVQPGISDEGAGGGNTD